MPSIKGSDNISATGVTSITVPLGGTPVVGDLVVVFIGVDNEIVTHQPGWATEFTATPNPWFPLNSFRAPDSSTLSGWYHTWNASDSGNTATFTFVPAPTLGIGDKDIPNVNVVAASVLFDGSFMSATLEHNIYGSAQDSVMTALASPLKLPAGRAIHGVFVNGTTANWTDSDPSSGLVNQISLSTPSGGMNLTVFKRSNSPAGYNPMFASADGAHSPIVQAASFSDNMPQLYNPPYIEEGPMSENALMYRYRINRYFTVLNNGGTFSAQRYQSTDQIAAATQVFVNNQSIASTDRTNLLNSGVGGDFQAVS